MVAVERRQPPALQSVVEERRQVRQVHRVVQLGRVDQGGVDAVEGVHSGRRRVADLLGQQVVSVHGFGRRAAFSAPT